MIHSPPNRFVVPAEAERVATVTVDAAITVHRELGPGLLESAYEHCLAHELEMRGLPVRRQIPVPLQYRGTLLEVGYRADLLVGSELLVELKAAEEVLPIHRAQVITYLKLLCLPLGLLLNFNVDLMKHGIHRNLNIPRAAHV